MDPLLSRVTTAIGDNYAVESEIGRGAVGVVYAARDLRLGRRVAIKVLPPDLAYRGDVRTRFLREAETSAKLSHPNIVPIYDVGERDSLVFFVMALVEGGSLAAALLRDKRPPIAVVRRVLSDVAGALAHAHARGVVHRDIKPDNVLLDSANGRAIVSDFGIARAAEGDERITATGSTVGSPAYMSPEQALGDPHLDGRSDIYSLAVVGYEMLAGETPFRAGSTPAMLMKHVSDIPRSLRDLRPDAPPALLSAIEMGMQKRPEHRWPDAAAFCDALARTGSSSTSSGTRPAARPPSARPRPSPPAARTSARPAAQDTPHEHAALDRSASAAGAAGPISYPQTPSHELDAFRDAPPARGGSRLVQIFGMPLESLPRFRGTGAVVVLLFMSVCFGVVNAAPGLLFLFIIIALAVGVVSVGRGVVKLIARLLEDATGGRIAEGLATFSQGVPAPAGSEAAATTADSEEGDEARQRMAHYRAPLPRAAGDRSAAAQVRAAQKSTQSILYGEYVQLVRNAMEEKKAIVGSMGALSPEDRALLPPVLPTATALFDRVCTLAQTLHRLDSTFDPESVAAVETRLAKARAATANGEGDRRIAMLERQRDAVAGLARRREDMLTQLDSAVLALVNLKLDLLRLDSEGLASVLDDVTSATQEARSLSRDIGNIVEAAAEVKKL